MAMKGEEGTNWIATNTWGRPWRRVWGVTFLVFITMLFAAPRCTAQALKKGISVEEAVTRNAVAMPDADKEGALIVAVTQSGSVYLGIDPITPAALAEKSGLSSRAEEKLYIKADARTPYANVAKVLDAVRKAGVTSTNLLTAQDETPEPGKLVPPKGLEVLVGPPLSSGAESTVVQVLNSGQRWPLLQINNEDIPWANLESRLRQLYQNHSKKVVLLKADGLLPFRNVVHVIDVCRSTGAEVYLATPAT
jgi:biopolymer transport protein ExbD